MAEGKASKAEIPSKHRVRSMTPTHGVLCAGTFPGRQCRGMPRHALWTRSIAAETGTMLFHTRRAPSHRLRGSCRPGLRPRRLCGAACAAVQTGRTSNGRAAGGELRRGRGNPRTAGRARCRAAGLPETRHARKRLGRRRARAPALQSERRTGPSGRRGGGGESGTVLRDVRALHVNQLEAHGCRTAGPGPARPAMRRAAAASTCAVCRGAARGARAACQGRPRITAFPRSAPGPWGGRWRWRRVGAAGADKRARTAPCVPGGGAN